jgi:2-methylisocitrate lyase-like PEP mutase family enzyme
MISRITKAHAFKEMHISGKPFILHNICDAGSARAVEQPGAPPIATGS